MRKVCFHEAGTQNQEYRRGGTSKLGDKLTFGNDTSPVAGPSRDSTDGTPSLVKPILETKKKLINR